MSSEYTAPAAFGRTAAELTVLFASSYPSAAEKAAAEKTAAADLAKATKTMIDGVVANVRRPARARARTRAWVTPPAAPPNNRLFFKPHSQTCPWCCVSEMTALPRQQCV